MPDAPKNPATILEFGPAIARDAEKGSLLEWLETNGLGDLACGTVAGPLTRREHGLFTVGKGPGGKPMLLLAQLDEWVELAGERIPISCHQYAGARTPDGFLRCRHFSAAPAPEWRFEIAASELMRRLFLPRGRRATVVMWTLGKDAPACRLSVRPLFAYRDADALTTANPDANMMLAQEGRSFRVAPYAGCPEFHVSHSGGQIRPDACWYYRFEHAHDVALGRDAQEDLFSPCVLTFDLLPCESAWIIAGVESVTEDATALERLERDRRNALTLFDLENDPRSRILARAAEAFPADGGRIVTALPAVEEDLRSALIALPGILLCTRRLVEARDFLRRALDAILRVPEAGDEALWYARAGELYVDHARDWDFLRDELTPGADRLAQRYLQAEAAGFHAAQDGLLTSDTGRPLTWMNAFMADWAATPRTGKPVEVNALWHHMLALLSRWWGRRNDGALERKYASLRELCLRSFRQRFWNESQLALYDVVDSPGGGNDDSVRPNQLMAVALPGDLLERRQAAGVLSIVEKRLVTPRGLRTLSIESPAFRAHLDGAPAERAAAQHQGAVYPWLIGAYVDAVFRVQGRVPRAYARAAAALEPFLESHLKEACLGQISECFNAAAPHSPRGSFAHAAAVGEVTRAYLEVKGRIW